MLILTALKHMLYFYRVGGATAVLVFVAVEPSAVTRLLTPTTGR